VIDDNPLVKEVYLDASPELVFSYLTEQTKMLRWLGLTLEIDARPGGIFRMDPNGRELIRGEYLEVIPQGRVHLGMGTGQHQGPCWFYDCRNRHNFPG